MIASPPGAISYYGTATGAAVQNMAFVSNGLAVTVSLIGQLTNQIGSTANPGFNVFGWYTINPNGTIDAQPLWNSKTDFINAMSTFSPGPAGTQYGLYLENIQGAGTSAEADYFWFMNSSSDYGAGTAATVDTKQHFAVFYGGSGPFYIGIDDTNNGDEDFNNMVIELQNVPEPRTTALFALGCLAMVALSVRRNAFRSQN